MKKDRGQWAMPTTTITLSAIIWQALFHKSGGGYDGEEIYLQQHVATIYEVMDFIIS
ncbi:hypothetical protein ACFL6S_24075 [Candidatus Poribacteria bacterium]